MTGGPGSSTQGSQFQFGSSTTSTDLPDWVTQAGVDQYGKAQGIYAQPYDPNRDQTVAGFTPDQLTSFDMVKGGVGATKPATDAAIGTTTGLLGYEPGQITAGQLASTDLSPYMDPYIRDVIQATSSIYDQNRRAANTASRAAAAGTGGIGGSRLAITEGVNDAQSSLGLGQLAAQLYSRGFENAQAAATGDINRRFDSDKFNTTAGLEGAKFRLGASNDLVSQAGKAQEYGSKDNQAMAAIGLQQQALEQAKKDAKTSSAQQRYQDQIDKLNLLVSTLGASPYETSQTQTSMGFGSSQGSKSQSLDPAAIAAGGIKALGLGGPLSSLGPSIGGGLVTGAMALLPMLSEDTEKTDVKKLGKLPSGLSLFAYRYKGDPKTYPKVVGLMASDVSKIVPDAVRRLADGTRVVDYNLALGE